MTESPKSQRLQARSRYLTKKQIAEIREEILKEYQNTFRYLAESPEKQEQGND